MRGKWYRAYLDCVQGRIEDEEYDSCVEDLVSSPQVQSLHQWVQHYDINRLEHVQSVSYISYLLCRKWGADYRTAARGGILHDLFFYDWHATGEGHRLHGIRHPGFALRNAREIFGPLDSKLENIIHSHMFPLMPVVPRSREAIAVILADKYCVMCETYTERLAKRAKEVGQ